MRRLHSVCSLSSRVKSSFHAASRLSEQIAPSATLSAFQDSPPSLLPPPPVAPESVASDDPIDGP